MRLVDLDPHFYGSGGHGITDANGNPVPERSGIGLWCDCPCGKCGVPLAVSFENPIDGGPAPYREEGRPLWRRTGDTFETLTLTPSILRRVEKGGCGWHGFLTGGVFKEC